MNIRESVRNIMPCVREAAPPVGMALGIFAVALKNHLLPNVGELIHDLPVIAPPIAGVGMMYFGFLQLLKK